MTLKDWQRTSGEMPIYSGQYDSEKTIVFCDTIRNEQTRAALWTLDDYRVSSVSGGSIWLIKKENGQ